MLLSTPARSSVLSIICTAPTAVEPASGFSITLQLTAVSECSITKIDWNLPPVVSLESPASGNQPLPLAILANATETYTAKFKAANKEGFGLIKPVITYQTATGQKQTLECECWISVFAKTEADETQLVDNLRQRLLDVVNARPRNGHIFLADYAAFFSDFLNITVPDRIAKIISRDFGLPDEGLPVDPETRLLIILGLKRFYGIENLKLIAEEECVESDDRFDANNLREVFNP